MAADSKTEKATPKKRRDERKEGNVFQSKDIVNVVFVFVAFVSLDLLFPFMYSTIDNFFAKFIGMIANVNNIGTDELGSFAMDFLVAASMTILPLATILIIASILTHGAQTKFLFAPKSFKPKLSRLSPIEGFKRMFSLKNAIELVKNLIKIIILIAIVYSLLSGYIEEVIRTMDMDVETSAAFLFDMVINLIYWITGAFSVIAFFDYLLQKWDYERKIRMSKQEIKEEFKQTEGNPQIKGKIREMQRQRARSRMIQAVPNADVIIKNPTHFAVALAYDKEVHRAPIVIAKGVDYLALKISEVGEANNVTVIENVPLARGIYANTEIGHEIPEEYYGAVAEVLVYVYKLNNKMR